MTGNDKRSFSVKNTLGLLVVLVLFGFSATSLSAFEIGIMKYEGGDWYSCRSSVMNFVKQYRERFPHAAISVHREGLSPADPEFFGRSFYILNGHGMVKLHTQALQKLRLFLDSGGFLFVNDDYGIDKSFRKLVKKLYPEGRLVEIPNNHDIYTCQFAMKKGLPKVHKHDGGPAQGLGLFRNGRMVLFYAYNTDIIDGWDPPEVHKDPASVRREAFRMGCNIIFFALTR